MATPDTPCSCLALRQASRVLTQRYDDALAPSGLRVTQYSVLARLHRLGPSSVQQLAEALVMDRSTLGHNLRPLERDGLVALETHPTDKRTRRLELTELGKSTLARARPLWRQAQSQFEATYGRDASDQLRSLLRRVTESTP